MSERASVEYECNKNKYSLVANFVTSMKMGFPNISRVGAKPKYMNEEEERSSFVFTD